MDLAYSEKNRPVPPAVCAVIVTWNKAEAVLKLLDQLLCLDYPQHRLDVVVVDNASGDGTAERISEGYQYVTLIRNADNLGGAGGFNAGMRYVLQHRPEFDYLWLLDNDVELDHGALRELVNVLESHADAAVCGSRIVDVSDRQTTLEVGAFIDNRRGDVRSHLPSAEAMSRQALWPVDYVAACSLLARAEAIRRCGLFCERLFIYWDDMEWGARLRQAGYSVVATRDSVVYHPSWAGRSVDDSAIWRNFYRIRNGLWYFDLYTGGLRRRWLLLKLMVLSLLRAILVNLQQGRSHLARAINNAVFYYMKDQFGRGQLAFPGVGEDALPLKEKEPVCLISRDAPYTERHEQFLCDLKHKYHFRLTCLIDDENDRWASSSCVDAVRKVMRHPSGALTFRSRMEVMWLCLYRRITTLLWFGAETPKYLPMSGVRLIKITGTPEVPHYAVEGSSFKALAFSMALMPLCAGVILRKWFERQSHPALRALPDEARSDLYRHPVDPAALEYHRWLQATDKAGCAKDPVEPPSGPVPLFSIVLPVYQPELKYLSAVIDSLLCQTFQSFEICIGSGFPGDETTRVYLDGLCERHSNIRVTESTVRLGISENTNAILPLVKGRYVLFCDHDDVVHPNALADLAKEITANPETDLLYTDMDHMDPYGRRLAPRLQPDWSPDMMTSQMYCPHLVCMAKPLLDTVGGLDPALDGAQDYDLFLRASEKARRIGHVCGVHYSWRQCRTSILSNCMAKPHAFESARQALIRALHRRDDDAVVVKSAGTNLGIYRVKRRVKDRAVTHILPSGPFVYENLLSIRSVGGDAVDVIVVCESGDATFADRLSEFRNVEILPVERGATLAVAFNEAARNAQTEHLIFSGADTEVLDSDYPMGLLEHVQRPEIGVVGCRLFYPSGALFHAGILLGVNGLAGYSHRYCNDTAGFHNVVRCIRNCMALSWELMAVRKSTFLSAGGFDAGLPAYVDVDFCIKLHDKGLRHLYTPYVSGVLKQRVHDAGELYHPEAAQMLLNRYGERILRDPYYHPYLARDREDYALGRVDESA